MLIRMFFWAITLIWAGALFGDAVEEVEQPSNLVKNSSFDSGARHWEHVDGVDYRVEKNSGYNGNSGLCYSKKKGAPYVMISQKLPALKPGVTYAYGAMVKCDNVTHPGVGVCLEAFSKDGKFLAGGYTHKLKGTQDWKALERTFSTKLASEALPKDCEFILKLVVDARSVGDAYFDDVFVKEICEEWLLSQVYPTHNSVTVSNGNLRFFSKLSNTKEKPEDLYLNIELKKGEKVLTRQERAIKDNLVNVDLGNLPEGDFSLKISLASKASKRVIGVREFPLIVKNEAGNVSSSCFFDIKGRAIVNGELFMPIGLFTQELTDTDFNRIKEAGFNCVMPYAIINSRCKDFDDVQKYFDNAKRTDIKIIPALINFSPACERNGKTPIWNKISGSRNITEELVKRYRNNPYLLAWSINDEAPSSFLKQMTDYREFVNKLDPNHPTWAVICRKNEIQQMSVSTDIMGVDPYPIRSADSTLIKEDNFGVELEELTMPIWSVPQIFDWGVCLPKIGHVPTREQMLSICLLQAIHGAKGFIMFSYCDLFSEKTPARFEQRWPDIRDVATELKQLESFIMSGVDDIPITINQIKGLTRVRCLSDGKGNYRLLAVGVDQRNEAEIILPDELDAFSSKTNAIVKTKNGRYKFIGGGCAYDILSGKLKEHAK